MSAVSNCPESVLTMSSRHSWDIRAGFPNEFNRFRRVSRSVLHERDKDNHKEKKNPTSPPVSHADAD